MGILSIVSVTLSFSVFSNFLDISFVSENNTFLCYMTSCLLVTVFKDGALHFEGAIFNRNKI